LPGIFRCRVRWWKRMDCGWRCWPAQTGVSTVFESVLRILLTSPRGFWIAFWIFFLGVVECAKNKGILRKTGVLTWCFDGVSVVICVAEMVYKQSLFWGLKIRQGFQLYFWERLCPAGRAHCAWRGHFVTCIPLRSAPVGREGRLIPTNGRTTRSSKKERPRSESETFPVTRVEPSQQCLD